MKRIVGRWWHWVWVVSWLLVGSAAAEDRLRVAVVGGIDLCGVWERLMPAIEAATGIGVETIDTGPKEIVMPAFRGGRVDLLLIHGSDEALAALADGAAAPLRPWAFNEHVILGPEEDPAGIAGETDAARALARIAAVGAPFVASRDPGSHGIVHRLWRREGVQPRSTWVIPDEVPVPQQILAYAAARRAYVVAGHIPFRFGKIAGERMRVMVRGDPRMRRLYVMLEPGPRHPAGPQARAAARRVADWLVSPEGQTALVAADASAGGPWIFPLP